MIQLPPEFGQTAHFELEEISRYDDRGPAWYWNNFRSGEHTGTHFDAPNHWVTGTGGIDVAEHPGRSRLIRPAVVLDFSAECAENPDFLLEVDHISAWEAEHAPLPDGGWMIYRTGWDARSDSQERFINADETGPHTPGMSPSARGGSPRSHRWSGWASRPSAPTRGPPTPSTRPSRATRS